MFTRTPYRCVFNVVIFLLVWISCAGNTFNCYICFVFSSIVQTKLCFFIGTKIHVIAIIKINICSLTTLPITFSYFLTKHQSRGFKKSALTAYVLHFIQSIIFSFNIFAKIRYRFLQNFAHHHAI